MVEIISCRAPVGGQAVLHHGGSRAAVRAGSRGTRRAAQTDGAGVRRRARGAGRPGPPVGRGPGGLGRVPGTAARDAPAALREPRVGEAPPPPAPQARALVASAVRPLLTPVATSGNL